jgi:hypothetical protein
MIHRRNNAGAEKGVTTIVGRSKRGAGDSEEDILESGRKEDVYVTRTVEVRRGI